MNHLLPILLVILSGCSTQSTADQNSQPLPTVTANKVSPTRTYWPLDHVPKQSRIVLPGSPNYCITSCLNDSAVVNPITIDTGPALDVSHNYESVLMVTKRTRLWVQARLTKELFRHNWVAQTLGLLSSLSLSRTAFTKYQAPGFRFTTRLGIPDSDIFAEAEVALVPNQGLRLVSVKMQEDAE